MKHIRSGISIRNRFIEFLWNLALRQVLRMMQKQKKQKKTVGFSFLMDIFCSC